MTFKFIRDEIKQKDESSWFKILIRKNINITLYDSSIIYLDNLIFKKYYIKKIKEILYKKREKIKVFLKNSSKLEEKIFNKVKIITKEKIKRVTELFIIDCSRVLRI